MIPPLRRSLLPIVALVLLGGLARAEIDDLPQALLHGNSLPDPDWSAILDGWIKKGRPIPELPPEEIGPPETATPAEQLAYWRNSWPWEKGQEPNPAMREKILEAVIAHPAAAADALRALPQSEDAAKAVAGIIPRMPAATEDQLKDQRKVRAWVFRHSGVLREEVIADARLADWKRYKWWTDGDETLDALKEAEPALARKVFENLAKADSREMAVVATGLLLETSQAADAGKWRDQLIAAASDSSEPEEARKIAVRALIKDSWPGKDAWFLGAMKQEDIGELYWYDTLVTDSPDRWIGPLVGLLEGENRHAHSHAACLLVNLSDRPEAIRPLLPWLGNPDWAKGRYSTRRDLIRALEEVRLPECVSALRHVVLHDTDEDCVDYACSALVHYHAREAVTDIKSSISRDDLKQSRHPMAKAVHELGGFSTEEIASSIAAFFREKPEGGNAFDLEYHSLEGMSPTASVGSYFAISLPGDQVPVGFLIKHAGDLRKEHPEAATALLNFCATAPLPEGRKVLAQLLDSGQLAEESLVKALEWRRENKEKWDGSSFLALTGLTGARGGFAAVLSGERGAMDKALASGDFHKRHAVIAAAWLARDALDIDQLSRLYSEGQDDDREDEKEPTEEQEALADAAWSYLLASEDPKAVSFVKKQKGDPLATEAGKPTRERASEIFSMMAVMVGNDHGSRSLAIFPDHVLATTTSRSGRQGSCTISLEKVAALRNYVSTYHADELPALEWGMQDGSAYYYGHSTKDDAKSVYMSNPPENRDSVRAMLEEDEGRFSRGVVLYGQLMWQFNQVFEGLTMDYGYGPGIDVLIPRQEGEVHSVWKSDGEIRVLTGDPGEWRIFSTLYGRLMDAAARPPDWLAPASGDEAYPELGFTDVRKPWPHRSGEAVIQSDSYQGKQGLWRYTRDKEPERIVDGELLKELISPDGQWCVAQRPAGGDGQAGPKALVRIKLATKEIFPINLPATAEFEAITFLGSHGKFLIRRSCDYFAGAVQAGPEMPEYHLLDPASGELEKVNGNPDFAPLWNETPRPLQPTGEAFKVWTVDPSPTGNRTIVGRYDTKAFKFTPVKEIEGIRFNSAAMWVDEAEEIIYAAVNGDLVRIPMEGDDSR